MKGKGIKSNEDRFHDVNYQYAKYIIFNPSILKEKFADNREALEYVLSWHPTYGIVTDKDYQNILINVGELTKVSHLRVFSRSFVLFGRFVSQDFSHQREIEEELKLIEKFLEIMRKEYKFYFCFSEFRASIARILYYFHYQDNKNLVEEINHQYNTIKNIITVADKVWSAYYLADCFNLIGFYDEAYYFHSLISQTEWNTFRSEYHCIIEIYICLISVRLSHYFILGR